MDLLKAMHSFRVVVQQQGFSAAARELNLVTSAVSRQVSELERHLGCKLLQRTTRSMILTEEGRHYLTRIEDILERVAQLEEEVSERQQRIAGRLRITAPLHAGNFGLQAPISQFLRRYPEVQLSWLIVNRYVNLVEEGIDLAIRVGDLPDSGLVARELGRLQVHFVASPEYLARNGTPQTPEQLPQHRCILDSSNRQPGRWRYRGAKGIQQVSVDDALAVNSGELAGRFAADGLGIACLPAFLVQPALDAGQLVRILSDYEPPAVPVSLVYPANRMLSPALRALIDHLLATGPELD